MIPDPFGTIASEAMRLVRDAWITAWLWLWDAGVWLLRTVLGWMDAWLTPNLADAGPGRALYGYTYWIAGAIAVVMAVVQIGVSAVRRDGRGLARALIGVAQFAILWGAWVGYTALMVAAASGLTRALMESLLGVTNWSAWQPLPMSRTADITEGATATVLGLLGLLVWIAAIGHLLVLLARDAALLVLAATTPIAAAGLPNETTRAWFWKAFRWFHAAAFTPVLVVLVTGIGMKFAEGTAHGASGSAEATVGTALPAVLLICVAVVSPLALFKLLAFVDPGTASGAGMRAGLAATGGIQCLLAPVTDQQATTGPAATASSDGRSTGEANAEAATTARATGVIAQAMAVLGPFGAAVGGGIGAMTRVGAAALGVGADLTNQAGIGNNSYYPDASAARRDNAARANAHQQQQAGPGSDPDTTATDTRVTTAATAPPQTGAGGASSAAAGEAAAIPPVA